MRLRLTVSVTELGRSQVKDKKTKKTNKPATKKTDTVIKDLPPARDPKGGRGGWDGNHNAITA